MVKIFAHASKDGDITDYDLVLKFRDVTERTIKVEDFKSRVMEWFRANYARGTVTAHAVEMVDPYGALDIGWWTWDRFGNPIDD